MKEEVDDGDEGVQNADPQQQRLSFQLKDTECLTMLVIPLRRW